MNNDQLIDIDDPREIVGGDYLDQGWGLMMGLAIGAGLVASGGLLLAAAAVGAGLVANEEGR